MIALIAMAMSLGSVEPAQAKPGLPSSDDPLTRPIAQEQAKEWLAPVEPRQIYGNSYFVGFAGLSVVLIDTGAGLVLIDGALPQAAPAILRNIRKLGFDPKDIKYILSTEPHFDHAGGIAALVRETGATVVASARGAEGLRAGRHAADDPQAGYGGSWPAVRRVRVIKDGERLALGRTTITANATPGHTMGSMSWSWRTCEGARCKDLVFASSLNPVSAPGYRYDIPSSRPIVSGFAVSYRRMSALRCDILISAHPDNAGPASFSSAPGACRAYVDRSRRLLAKRLAQKRIR